MLRWIFLAAGLVALGLMIGYGTEVAIFAAFVIVLGNFATFCLQYNGPMDRAQSRINALMAQAQVNSDEYQRLETAKAKPSAEDRSHPRNLTSILNAVTGVGCIVLLVWAVTFVIM